MPERTVWRENREGDNVLNVMAPCEWWLPLHVTLVVSRCPSHAGWVKGVLPRFLPSYHMSVLVSDHWASKSCASWECNKKMPGHWIWGLSLCFVSLHNQEGWAELPYFSFGTCWTAGCKGFQIRAIPSLSQTILAHPISKQAFLPSPLAFPIAVQIRVECFPAYQAVFALLLMSFYTSHSPSLFFVPRLG